MSVVFKKSSTRPVPAGATITTTRGKETARWKGRGAKTKWITAPVFTLADGRKVIRQESSTYFCRWRDHLGVVHCESTKCKDRQYAEDVLRNHELRVERIRAGILSPAEDAAGKHQQVPLDTHVDEYCRTLRGAHAVTTAKYIRNLATALHLSRLNDMRRSDLEGWLAAQIQAGRGARSRNAYLTAATSFCNWCVKNGRMTVNPFDKMPHANLEADHRRQRRAFTPLELARLVAAARATPGRPRCHHVRKDGQTVSRPADKLSGDDRADLYLFLAGTGIRIGEAKQLMTVCLEFGSPVPAVRLAACTTKNGRESVLPLRRDLVEMLQDRIARLGLQDHDPVFSIPVGLLKRFHADCRRAGIPHRDSRGRQVDLHALRLTFGTSLAAAGVPMRTAQQLMRHSDINLTSKIYVDPALLDLAGAVEAIAPHCVAETVNSTSPQESSGVNTPDSNTLLKFG